MNVFREGSEFDPPRDYVFLASTYQILLSCLSHFFFAIEEGEKFEAEISFFFFGCEAR